MNVINIEDKLKAKRQAAKDEEHKAFFRKMFADAPPHILKEMQKAINNGDLELYKRVTEPIIMRKTIAEYNKGML